MTVTVIFLLSLISLSTALVTIPLTSHTSRYRRTSDNETRWESVVGVGHLMGRAGLGYYMQVSIGTPSQQINVLVDTGSSNFAVATSPHPFIDTFFNTSLSRTFNVTSEAVSVPYTEGHWEGYLATEVLYLPSLLPLPVTLSCIHQSSQFFINTSHWQGILGLAYPDIARPDSSVQPVFETLVENHVVDNIFSLQLCPSTDTTNTSRLEVEGALILGGVDHTLYTGPVVYVPIRRQWYYEVLLTDVQVDGHSVNLPCSQYNSDKTIVDSGTTNLRLPQKVFDKVLTLLQASLKLPGDKIPDDFWEGSGQDVLCWEEMPWSDFPYIQLHLAVTANSSFELSLSPHQYLRPIPAEHYSHEKCFRFAISPSDTGSVLGAVVLEAYYVIFDRENVRLGFAVSSCPHKDTSLVSSLSLPQETPGVDYWSCAYDPPSEHTSTMITVVYVMTGICGACLIPLLALILHWRFVKRNRRQSRDPFSDSLLTEDMIS